MALRSDDGDSDVESRQDRIDEAPEEEEKSTTLPYTSFPVTSPVPIEGQDEGSEGLLGTLRNSNNNHGPSNLSKAMIASQSTSPATLKAGGQSAASTLPSSPTEERQDKTNAVDATEDTPLFPSRGRVVRESPSKSRETSRTDSSASPAPRDRSAANNSGFSAFSVRSSGGARNNSSTYGYGALAKASSMPSGGLGSQTAHQHVTFAEPEEGATHTLSPVWAVVPARFRPGRGAIAVKETSLFNHGRAIYASASKLTWREAGKASVEPIRLLPAVVLGLLLNILDGVSYGLIIFPTSYPIFSDFGGDGVSMFFVTCVISQLVYSLGGSIFRGGNGSMMIEVVPFYHILVTIIIDTLGDDDPAAVVSTTIVAFALSSIFAGIVFLLLGYFRLGVLVGFFPRHILVGCIGGVGVFLIETGLEVSSQLKSEEGFQWNLETFRYFTQSWFMVAHWLPALGLAILLRLITSKFHQPLIFPAFFLCIPIVFYIIASGICRVPLAELRKYDWVFDVGKAADAPFYRFYTYFDFRKTSWRALWATMPTQVRTSPLVK